MKPLICPEDGKPCTCASEPVGTLHRTGDPKVGCPREGQLARALKIYPDRAEHHEARAARKREGGRRS